MVGGMIPPMPVYKHAVHIAARTGLPADDSVNTLYTRTPAAATDGQLDAIMGIISTYYTNIPSGHAASPSYYYSADRDPASNACRIDTYLMPSTRGDIGTPVRALHFTWSPNPGSTVPLPDQVAVCQSYQASVVGVVNPRRYKGRFFLGPLNNGSMYESSGGLGAQTVNAEMRTIMNLNAQQVLGIALEALSSSPRWVQWSSADWVARDVVQASVDERFDTQRRRLQPSGFRDRVVIA